MAAGQAEAQAVVAGEREARHDVLVRILCVRRLGALARADDAHTVALPTQLIADTVQRHSHAVDFGRVGFSDDTEFHCESSRSYETLDLEASRGNRLNFQNFGDEPPGIGLPSLDSKAS